MSESTTLRVKAFLRDAANTSLDQFCAKLTCPVLIVLGGITKTEGGFNTRAAASIDISEFVNKQRKFDLNARVFPLNKRHSANQYSDMIIIGRAPNSDIHLQISEVSKMQAYFTWKDSPDGKTFQIADGASRNGTFINGKKLKPHSPHELETGEVIAFGSSIFLRFYTPPEFYSALMLMKNDQV